MILNYHLFLFTDFLESDYIRNILGWSSIGICGVMIVANMGIMIMELVRTISLVFPKIIKKIKENLCYSKRKESQELTSNST